jgi:Protein of unknown function (DUF1501)
MEQSEIERTRFMTHSSSGRLSRRDWLKLSAAGVVSHSLSGWLEAFADDAVKNPQRKRSCIVLWMNGGPSQIDTFDPKPDGPDNVRGQFKPIKTSVNGIQISEHLPNIAKQMDRMAIVRSMTTKEADHTRGTYLMHTGRAPGSPVLYPALGSVIAKEIRGPNTELPSFVSIAPFRFFSPGAYGPGFLGPQYAPLVVGEQALNFNGGNQNNNDYEKSLKVQDLDLPAGVADSQARARLQLMDDMEKDFLAERSGPASLSHYTAYQRAVTMMRSEAVKAFNLEAEPKELRDRYGRNLFGQGCLLARRLVERGVGFVEVTLSSAPGVNNGIGWDTHVRNFESVKSLSTVLDAGWSTLMDDLKSRGMLDSTLIAWMGEFGRTPKLSGNGGGGNGRDHWANSWSTVLAGGGIKGGQVIGKTSKDGSTIEDRPVSVNDLLATIGVALGIDVSKQNMSNVSRPIRIVEPGAKPIVEAIL